MILGSESMLGLALFYASLGWLVFPCWWIAHGSCACGGRKGCSPGKHPMTPGGLKSATTDPDQIRAWWGRCLDANIGMRTGPETSIWVLDVDGEKGSSDLAGEEDGITSSPGHDLDPFKTTGGTSASLPCSFP